MKENNQLIPFRTGNLSVQASEYHYCQPKHDNGPYFSYEVAFINSNDSFGKIPELGHNGDDVYGYVNKNVVVDLLTKEGYTPSTIRELLPNE
jgi:hypothetical protein